MLSKVVSSTIFKVFGMTRPGIEPRSPGPLAKMLAMLLKYFKNTAKMLVILFNWFIGLVGSVFANGPRDLGSIPGRVIPKIRKMVLDPSQLNTQHYKVRIKVKWSNPGKGVAPSPTPWCNSYRKGSLRVTLD